MTEWHTIPAKLSSDEKKILDKLREMNGWSYNQSLKYGLEVFARMIAMGEYYASIDNKAYQKIRKIGFKYNKMMEDEIKEVFKSIPLKEQKAQVERLLGVTKVWSQADNIFVKNRKRGRKLLKRKRGRPKDTGNS
ncbi:MAG: hypothetical protein ACREAK_04815 [Nitrosarchaeum sp.]